MSQKAHKAEGQPACQPATSFASLPEAVVAHIALLSKPPRSPGHPLLQVSRSCRDAVLSSCTSLTLHTAPVTQQASEACARLLHRACCQARPGLQLKLDLEGNSDALPHFLKPGLDCGGWRNVRKLIVGVQSRVELCE
jgi:hypothetical protein